MNRLWFSVALLAALFCFWLVLTKPICRDGFAASLGTRSGWTCVADDSSEVGKSGCRAPPSIA